MTSQKKFDGDTMEVQRFMETAERIIPNMLNGYFGTNFTSIYDLQDEEEILLPAELLADYFKKRKALDHEIDKTLAEIQRKLGIEINIEE